MGTEPGFDLTARPAVVTGASSGIGAAIAGRLGTGEEIAGLVHYLVEPVGRFATGVSFRVDGGALAMGPFDVHPRDDGDGPS